MEKVKKRLSEFTLAHLLILVAMVLTLMNTLDTFKNGMHFGIGTLQSLILLAVPVLVFLQDQKNMKEIIGWLLVGAGGIWLFTFVMNAARVFTGGIIGLSETLPRYTPSLCLLGAGLRIALGEKCPKGLDLALEWIGAVPTLFFGIAFYAASKLNGQMILTNCLIAVGYSLLPVMEFSGVKKGIVKGKTLAWLVAAAVAIFLLGQIDFSGTSSGGGGSDSRVCKSCGRTFTDSANKNSIARTGMCKNCYNNFQWGMEATGRDTAWHIHGENEDCESMTLTFRSTEETELQELLCKLEPAADWSDAA